MMYELNRMFNRAIDSYERRFLEPDDEPEEAERIGELLSRRQEVDKEILKLLEEKDNINDELAELGAAV